MIVRKEDQPKVIALLIALVVVLAFVIRTAMGMFAGESPKPAATTAPPAPSGAAPGLVASAAPTPGVLPDYGALPANNEPNPFRVILKDTNSTGGSSNPPPSVPGQPSGTGGDVPPMPIVGEVVGGGPGIPGVPLPGPKPVRLDGVLTNGRGIAAVTVDGQSELMRVGKTFGGYRLVELSRTYAVLESASRRVRLKIGESAFDSSAQTGLPRPIE